jgi:hypothetical protein
MAALHGFRKKMKIREKTSLVFALQYGTKKFLKINQGTLN